MNQVQVPFFKGVTFVCPHCQAYAHMQWRFWVHSYSLNNGFAQDHDQLIAYPPTGSNLRDCFGRALCSHCQNASLWHTNTEKMVYPKQSPSPLPHEDMPEDAKAEYMEARLVFSDSPKCAAAMLRLALQRLLPHLGCKGKKIDDDIASLVAQGLPKAIQEMLDLIRVVGNEAVHPGTIDLNDTPETATVLFSIMNDLVARLITAPKQYASLYAMLPEDKLKGIANRDRPKPPKP